MSSKYAWNVTVMPSERDETDVMLDPRESDRNEGRIREGSWDPMVMLPRQNPALHAVSLRLLSACRPPTPAYGRCPW